MSTPQDHNDAENEGQNSSDNATGVSGDIAREAAQIAALHSEVAELKDRYLRAVAETENIRKRAEREKNDAAQFAFSRFAKDLLSVADNFERAIDLMKPEKRAALPPDAQSVMEGIEATHRQLGAVFERFGIKRIDAVGQKFNPNLHDAIAEVPSPNHTPGSVIAVAENGYVIGERLLRAAKVAIAAQNSQTSTSGGQTAEPGTIYDTNA
ncbi:MAG: nucleotide exchange factor GrpE [Micropepsaceae bacterium]